MTDAAADALSLFHPLIRRWFLDSVGRPTEVQERAWPAIARGEHVLVSAPTGTGKTLAAFLWAINQLATGALSTGGVRVLYISPLKALNNDIQRNLLAPLAQLEAAFAAAGATFPPVRVLTRSGDTPSGERRRMLRTPPEILITTPESLNLILSSANSRQMLTAVSVVILDEIHAVAATKRGTHLVTAVERLVPLCGEFQRIALSATVKPLAAVADLVAGFTREGPVGQPLYRKRRMQVVHCPMAKKYELRIAFPPAEDARRGGPRGTGDAPAGAAAAGRPPRPRLGTAASDDAVFDALGRECRRIIAESRSTLFFVNSRRHAEKLARFINEGQPATLAWPHHGSLSRELRLVVEQRLKAGELKAIVATSSLELGIDVGALERVILVQTPFTVASAVQRLGRAGHRVGEPSRGVLFPLHGKDIVDAAVTARAVREQDIEDLSPVLCPLDILAQLIVSMTSVETWKAEELFDAVRCGFPFNALPRRHFDLVLDMLAGRYEETRLRDLSAMVSYDRLEGTVRAKEAARLRLVTSGGTIPDRGTFSLRTADSKALIGELDEEFVWERAIGDTFVFGAQGWRIQKIDHQNVEVVPVGPRVGMAPFWKAEERNRGFHVSDRIARALEEWNGRLSDPRLGEELRDDFGMEPSAAQAMVDFLRRQREATGADLPHRHHLLVEHTRDPDGKAERSGVILHTLWGGKANRPFSLALSAAWEESRGYRPEMLQTDDAIMLFLPEEASGRELLSLVSAESLERLLRRRLEGSGFFGARFREAAGRALLIPKAAARRRTPLWLTRQRAKSLFAAVSRFDDFPLLLEAWRTCLRDEFDLGALTMLLGELASGAIRVSEHSTSAPSPFCGDLVWKRTNTLMYADDTPPVAGGTSLRGDLVRELALSPDLRPRIAPEVAAELQAKCQRTAEGYAPRDGRELLDWLKERLVVPQPEWEALLEACARDAGRPRGELLTALEGKIVERTFGENGVPCVAAAENVPRLERALAEGGGDAAAGALAEWLRFYGPVVPSFVAGVFGMPRERLDLLLADLVEEEEVVLDRLSAGSEALLLCDRENLERLLRMSRARVRPEAPTLPVEKLPLFIARHQGVVSPGADREDMKAAWEKLFGFPLPAQAWEEEVLPARLRGYRSQWMDGLLAEAGLLWLGCGRRRLTFCFAPDTELFLGPEEVPPEASTLFPGPSGRYSFWDIVDHVRAAAAREGAQAGQAGGAAREGGVSLSAAVSERLWDLAWKGFATSDSFQPVRRGIAGGFRAEETVPTGGRGRRRFDRWQASRPAAGLWHRVQRVGEDRDALDEEEITRDRARQVLQRYGVVFRELLENELPLLRWSRLFRSLRLMEFSGEVVTGRFFSGARGVQFALPSALEELAAEGGEERVWWLNAADPASLCGIDVEALKDALPSRLPTTHVVFRGSSVVLVSRRLARELEIRVPPEDPRIGEYLGFVAALTDREQRPMNVVHVQAINGCRADQSPYAHRLIERGFLQDYGRLSYRARLTATGSPPLPRGESRS